MLYKKEIVDNEDVMLLFDNDQSRFIDLFDRLNDDVLSLIFDKIPIDKKVWLTKENYIKHHKLIKKMIHPDFYQKYILDIVKQDYAFVFSRIIDENFKDFHKWKGYYYNQERHHSFLTFLRGYAISNSSLKCIEIIDKKAEENGFSPNWYKYRGIILRSK